MHLVLGLKLRASLCIPEPYGAGEYRAALSGQTFLSMPNDQNILAPLAVHRECPRCGKPVQPGDAGH